MIIIILFTSFKSVAFAKESRIWNLINYYLDKIHTIELQLKADAVKKIPVPSIAEPLVAISNDIPQNDDAETPTDEPNDTAEPSGNAVGAEDLQPSEKIEPIYKTNEPKIEPNEGVGIVNRMKTPEIVKGIYMTVSTITNKHGQNIIDKLLESGGNSVVIDIEHGGGLLAFTPKNDYLKSINPGSTTLDNLPEIINELHKKGLYVIARQVVFNDPYVGSRKSEWRIKNKWGGLYDYRWLDPSKPGVQNYNLYIMQEVADLGFDEIQFDYIRFPAASHYSIDCHYDEEKFSRSDIINDFLSKARRLADDKNIELSVDVFGAIVWGGVDWKIVGQNTAEMAKYVNAIYPMTYPSHVSPGYYGFMNPRQAPYSFVHDSIQNFVEKADGNAEIRTWVQGFPLRISGFGSWFMNEQVRATYDAKGTGYIIWSPGNIYTLSWPSFSVEPTPEEALEKGTGE